MQRQQKITLAEIRSMRVWGLLIYCGDYRCAHSAEVSADRWADDVRLSDLEPKFTCTVCGHHGADIRPDFATRDTAPCLAWHSETVAARFRPDH